jgi:hypothetical protein
MAEYIPGILLWLFVINHGIAVGAGLCSLSESRHFHSSSRRPFD